MSVHLLVTILASDLDLRHKLGLLMPLARTHGMLQSFS